MGICRTKELTIRQIGVYGGGNAILCNATKNGEENAPRRSLLELPLSSALAVLSQGSGGNVVRKKPAADKYHVCGFVCKVLPKRIDLIVYLTFPRKDRLNLKNYYTEFMLSSWGRKTKNNIKLRWSFMQTKQQDGIVVLLRDFK